MPASITVPEGTKAASFNGSSTASVTITAMPVNVKSALPVEGKISVQ